MPTLTAPAQPSPVAFATGRLPEAMSYAAWARAGCQLARVSHGVAWALGDWLLYGQARYGRRYRDALAATQLDYQTLRNYAWVARNVAPSRRRDTLSFQHHAEVAALAPAEQELWLCRAERGQWSRNRLRRELRDRSRDESAQAAPAVVLRVAVAAQREQRWREAASESAQDLEEWLGRTLDDAAEAVLHRRPA